MTMSDKKVKPAPAKLVDREEYNRIVDAASLLDVALIGSKFDVQPGYFSDGSDRRKLTTDFEILGSDCHDGIVIVVAKFCAKARKGRKIVLKTEATYNVVFSVPGDADCDAGVAFGSHMARFTAYPYFRSHVSHQSWESGAELPLLPVIKTLPRNSKISADSPD